MRALARPARPYTSFEARERAEFIEAARRKIPVNTYLSMLNHAALTGQMPKVDPLTGHLTNQAEDISMEHRIEITKYLLDKAMPSLKKIVPTEDDGMKAAVIEVSKDDSPQATQQRLDEMPVEALKKLLITTRSMHEQLAASKPPDQPPAPSAPGTG